MSRARSTKAARKRWPDVMIGALTLALLGGFGALLLEQGKPHPVTVTPQPAETNIPASPGTVPEPAQVPAQPAANTAAANTTPAPSTAQAPAAQTPATTPTAPAASGTPSDPTLAQTQEIPPAPKAPEVAPITPPVVPQAPAAQTQPTPQSTTPSDPTATPATPTATVPARSGGAVAVSANRTPLRSDYRISLGSFGSQRTAETQTANVRSLGYTVHSIDVGDQYVAQIGPFADETTARQALADIQRAYPAALLYRPRNAAASTTESAATPSSAGTADSNSSAASTNTTSERPQAAAPSGPTYLQVGAFDRIESAQNLVGILKDAGFAPTVNNPPDRKTTVMVGPYSGDALLRAETRLDNAGLEHFRVR